MTVGVLHIERVKLTALEFLDKPAGKIKIISAGRTGKYVIVGFELLLSAI